MSQPPQLEFAPPDGSNIATRATLPSFRAPFDRSTAAAMLAIGRFAYGVSMSAGALGEIVLYVLLGAATMCSVLIAAASVVSDVESASAALPFAAALLAFISGIFAPSTRSPAGWRTSGASTRSITWPLGCRPRSGPRATAPCPAARLISKDGNHPNDAGHAHIARDLRRRGVGTGTVAGVG